MAENNKGRAPRNENATPKTTDNGNYTGINALPKMSSDLHRVGGGYSVRFSTGGPAGIQAEWTPSVPSARDLRRKVDMQRYRDARNAFSSALVRALAPDEENPWVLILEAGTRK